MEYVNKVRESVKELRDYCINNKEILSRKDYVYSFSVIDTIRAALIHCNEWNETDEMEYRDFYEQIKEDYWTCL